MQVWIDIATLITSAFYVVALGYALWRQVAAWSRGWKTYGRDTTVGEPFNDAAGDRSRWSVRCSSHPHPRHVGAEDPIGEDQDTQRRNYAVQPTAIGIRTWSYEAKWGENINRGRWLGRCLKFFLARRFVEPDIDPCPWCEVYPRHDGHRLLDEVTSNIQETDELGSDEISDDL